MGAKPHPPPPAPQPVAVLGRRPQIARSMRLRLALRVATLLPALTCGAKLAAQEPSPYVPIGHRATPYLEHLIAAGVIDDPPPLRNRLPSSVAAPKLRAPCASGSRCASRHCSPPLRAGPSSQPKNRRRTCRLVTGPHPTSSTSSRRA